MASSPFPWYRVIVFTVLIAALGVWIQLGGMQVEEQQDPPAPGPGIGTPAPQADPVVVLDVLPHDVREGETPMFWLRVGNVAYDVPLPGPATDPGLQRQARELRESLLESLGEELHDLRREADDPDALIGEVRRGKEVPATL